MKEAGLNEGRLTRKGQEGYSKDAPQFGRGGDIFMAENGQEQLQQPPKGETSLSHAQKAAKAERRWKEFCKETGTPFDKLNVSYQEGIMNFARMGIMPPEKGNNQKEGEEIDFQSKHSKQDAKTGEGDTGDKKKTSEDSASAADDAGKGGGKNKGENPPPGGSGDGNDGKPPNEGSSPGANGGGKDNGDDGKGDTSGNSMPEPIKRIAQEMKKEAERLGPERGFSGEYLREQIGRIHRLIDEGKFSPEEVSKAHNFINDLNKSIDEITEKEASREKIILNEGDFKDSQIRSKISGVNSILEKIRSGRLSVEDYEKFIKQISELNSPNEYTSEQRNVLEVEKQKLKSLLSEVFINSLHPQSKDRVEKSLALKKAIEEKNLDEIERIIMEEMDIDDSNTYAPAIRDAILDIMKNKDPDQIDERDHMIEFLLEYGVERILGMADAKPKEAYPQFNLYQQMNLDAVLQAARKYDEIRKNPDDGMFKHLAELMSKRQIMHELFRSMKERKTYVEYVSGYLRKSGFAFVEKSIVGTSEVQIGYEKILGSMKSSKKTWLTDIDFEQVDEEMKTYLRRSNEKGILEKNLMNKDNKVIGQRKLRDWELKRAMFMGRSLNAACQRRITYGVLGDVPETTDPDTLFKSLEFEFLARILAPIKVIPQRFFQWPLGKWYMKTVIAEGKKQAEAERDGGRTFGYGEKEKDKEGNEHRKGLYGQSDDSFAVLDTGITDPKSNSWRGRLLFLKQKKYASYVFEDVKVSVGEYLEKLEVQIQEKVKQEYRNGLSSKLKDEDKEKIIKKQKEKIKDEGKKRFNDNLRTNGIIDQQRLFLGVLLKNKDGAFDLENRTALWKKAAHFIPSRMAAFFPEDTKRMVSAIYRIEGNNESAIATKWKEVQQKIWDAESLRVKNDAEVLKRLNNESWESVKGELKDISSYYERAGIGNEDARLISELQDLGESRAEQLAKIKFPFTAFLDDVPETDWENLTDEDFDRILINDQSAFEKGFGSIIGLISKPVTKPEDAAKAFVTAFEEIQSPLGQPDARKILEKHISTYLKMTRMNNWAKWFSGAMKIIREPRSEMEKGNLQAETAYDEEGSAGFLKVLAQNSVVSDDPSETDDKGLTQYVRLRGENDADVKAKMLMFARLILMLLGPVLGMELLKSILPPDLAKEISG